MRAPPTSLFPDVEDRWRLRWAPGTDYVVHRDRAAAFAIALLGLYERYAWARNQYALLTGNARALVLPRPAPYLYHTDYDKWCDGTLDVTQCARW